MTLEDFKDHFHSLGIADRDCFSEEILMFLDSLGFPSPNRIREQSREMLLTRYQRTFGNLQKGPEERMGVLASRPHKGFSQLESIFDLVDGVEECT